MTRWALLALMLWPQLARGAERFALVVGTNRSDQASVAPLRYADDDAIAIHRLLEDAGVHSRLLVAMDADTARLHPELSARTPTGPGLRAEFRGLLEQMETARGPVEFLFFYSGHGGVDHGQGYVVLEQGRLYRSELYRDVLSKSKAQRNHVIVDACKSYFMAFAKGPGGQRRALDISLAPAHAPGNTGFILSTSSGRDSHEWDRYQSGVFSYQVRSALRGAADADRDATISYAELGAFLQRANAAIANPRYRPDFAIRPPGAHPPDLQQAVLVWTGQADSLDFGAQTLKRAYLEGPKGERLADVHLRERERVRLYVPAQRPLFLREGDERKEWVIEDSGDSRLASHSPRPVAISRKGALHLAFEKLFSAPFGQEDVLAYRASYPVEAAPVAVQTAIPQRSSALEWSAGIASIALVTAGLTMTAWALERRLSGFELGYQERVLRDRDIRRLNAAALSLYGLSAAAGGFWLWLHFSAPAEAPMASAGPGVGLRWSGQF